jgi:hypothetical protein
MNKTIQEIAAQGDVTFVKIAELPKGIKLQPAPVDSSANGFVVAHSETGHHHVARLIGGAQFLVPQVPTSGSVAYLQSENEIDIDHLRDFDTHKSLKLSPGIWEVRRQREWSPERNMSDTVAD